MVHYWRPRLGIAEVVNVEVVSDDESTEREIESRCIPVERDGVGLWEFTVQIGDTIEDDRLERAVVHELVHVLLEPLRNRVFYGTAGNVTSARTVALLETWETVVDRVADGFLRAYQGYEDMKPAPTGGREFRAPA